MANVNAARGADLIDARQGEPRRAVVAVTLPLFRGINNVFGEDCPRGLSMRARTELGFAGLNGLPRFIQCADESANFVRTKRPNVFLEIRVHFDGRSLRREG